MLTERAAALFNTLERQAQRGLDEIAHLRQQLKALEAENSRLREALQQREAHASQAGGHQAEASRIVTERDSAALVQTSPTPETVQEAAREAPSEPTGAAPPSPQALLGEWYQRYAATFFKGHTQPLKVGIHEELIKREPWPDKLIRRALACYVHLPRYLKAVRAGAERVDLDGRPAGVVNEEEALHARNKLEALQARQREQGSQRERKPELHHEARKDAGLDHKLSELLAKHGRH